MKWSKPNIMKQAGILAGKIQIRGICAARAENIKWFSFLEYHGLGKFPAKSVGCEELLNGRGL